MDRDRPDSTSGGHQAQGDPLERGGFARLALALPAGALLAAIARTATVYLTYPDPQWEVRVLGELEIQAAGGWATHSLHGEALIDGLLGSVVGAAVVFWVVIAAALCRWAWRHAWAVGVAAAPVVAFSLYYTAAALLAPVVLILLLIGSFIHHLAVGGSGSLRAGAARRG